MLTACLGEGEQTTTTEPQGHVHVFKDEVVKPTCSTEGYTVHTCEECGYIKEDTFVAVDSNAHNYVQEERVEATCTEDGYVKFVCQNDHTHETIDVLPAGHKLGAYYVIVEPTCTEYGMERAFCSNCNHWEDRDIAPTHYYEVIEVVAPTCTSKGYTVEKCFACENTRTVNYVDESAHTWTAWITLTEGDCTTLGTKKHICIVCEAEEVGYSGYGHKYETAVTDPTCTTAGYTTYTCSLCNDVKEDHFTPAQHTWGDWTVVIAVSCKNYGIEKHTCLNCEAYEEKLIAPDHVYDNIIVIDPTDDESGYTKHACDCGNFYIDSYVPALKSDFEYKAHKYWDYVSNSYVTEYIVASMGNYSDVKDIVIPGTYKDENVTTIGYMAFYDCDTIERVYLTNNITKFDVAAFWNCDNLSEFHFDGTMEEWTAIDKGDNWDRGLYSYTVYCTDGEIQG